MSEPNLKELPCWHAECEVLIEIPKTCQCDYIGLDFRGNFLDADKDTDTVGMVEATRMTEKKQQSTQNKELS